MKPAAGSRHDVAVRPAARGVPPYPLSTPALRTPSPMECLTMSRSSPLSSPALPRGSRGVTTRRVSLSLYGYAFIAPFFIVFAIFQLYPILFSLYLSFTRGDGFSAPQWLGLANYRRLVHAG